MQTPLDFGQEAKLTTQPLEMIGRGDWIRTSDLMLPKQDNLLKTALQNPTETQT